jgi:hypothetical protein
MAILRALVLLVIPPPEQVMSAYLLGASATQQPEIETLVDSWGFGEIESLPDGAMLLPGAIRLELHNARLVDGPPIARAVVARQAGQVFEVFLCHDVATSAALARQTFGGQISGEILKLRSMPPINPHRGRVRWRLTSDDTPVATRGLEIKGHHPGGPSRADMEERLATMANALSSEDLAAKPGEWSSEFCPRCQDLPLHVDPALDGRSLSGVRICIACARRAKLPRPPLDDGSYLGAPPDE